MNKKAVSLMVSYVLLISIVIALSIGVFAWLKIVSNIKPIADCEKGTSIILNDYSCINPSSSNLKLVLKNNGRFNIDGIMLTVGNDFNKAPVIYLMPNSLGGVIAGNYFFQNSLEPGKEKEIKFTNKQKNRDILNLEEIKIIQIQPFIMQKKEKIICKNAVIKQNVENLICL